MDVCGILRRAGARVYDLGVHPSRMTASFEFDVLLSYAAPDAAVMRALGERLRKNGLRVTESGPERARTMVLALSRNAEWSVLEPRTLLFRDPSEEARRIVPLRLDDAEVPEALRQLVYVDWGRYERLLEACAPPVEAPALPKGVMRWSRPFKSFLISASISADGWRALTVAADGAVQVWDIARQQGTFLKESGGRTVATRSPGRRRRASSAFSRTRSSPSKTRAPCCCASRSSSSSWRCAIRARASPSSSCAPSSASWPGPASCGSSSSATLSSSSRSGSTPMPRPSSAPCASTAKRSAASARKTSSPPSSRSKT